MSRRYKGAIVSATPPTVTALAASGVWTLQQEMQAIETAWPFGGPFNYIEDFFSPYIYAGTGSAQSITNNLNVSGSGGLVWIKNRTSNSQNHELFDTARGATKMVQSNTTSQEQTVANTLTSFNSNGFTLGTGSSVGNEVNTSGLSYVSWTFLKKKKFFDIVTYTGDGTTTRNIAHSLGSLPGFIAIKSVSTSGDWACAAISGSNAYVGKTGTTFGFNNSNNAPWVSTASSVATTTTFSPCNVQLSTGSAATADVNANGVTYVAYIWASNAGGFGTSNQDNVVSCGTFTNDTNGDATVTLGYEPQWLMVKSTSTTSNWIIVDNMRNWSANGGLADNPLYANSSSFEAGGNTGYPTANGFVCNNLGGTVNTWMYLAVRRGPMAVPTSATSVFANNIGNDTVAQTTGFPVDMVWDANPGGSSLNINIQNRLFLQYNASSSNAAASTGNTTGWNSNTQITPGISGAANMIMNSFRRAPGFFDITSYTGNGGTAAFYVNHNLGVIPELIITKCSSTTGEWFVQAQNVFSSRVWFLNTNAGPVVQNYPFGTGANTSTQLFFNVLGSNIDPCKSGATYQVYLFATLAGISKVGSYTGTGALQTVNCGFTAGARFILIKRYSGSTGDWYVYNSASGISASSDPFMNTNNTSAQTTGTDYVDTDATGFKLNAAGSATVNISGAPYLFLAIA